MDNYTRFTHVAFRKKNSDTLKEFKKFVTLTAAKGHGTVRALRTDNSTEYVSIIRSNIIYVRRVSNIKRLRHTLLSSTATYVKNLNLSRVLNKKVPRKQFHGNNASYGHLRTFWCLEYLHNPKEKRKKWDPLARSCIFVG